MYSGTWGCVSSCATACLTLATLASLTKLCPTSTAGAWSQSPTHGARTTRTSSPKALCRSLSSFCAEHGTGQAVANTDGERRNIPLALLYDVEVRIERGGFEDLGECQAHLGGERGQ